MANHIAINTTSAGIPQQLQATQPLVPEQHSHHWQHAHTYLNNTSTASIYASNTLVIHITAMHPPPVLCSHHQSCTATTGDSNPIISIVTPALSTLLIHAIAIQPPPELHSHQ
jgi:hypothetical protein